MLYLCTTITSKHFNLLMYYISKRLVISASHRLELSYPSKCSQLHGHNWTITVYCKALELNADGMVVDFKIIKQRIESQLDHANLNEVLPCNPTAENAGCAIRFPNATALMCRKARATWQRTKRNES